MIRRKRGAHVGLVGGVGALPVREVGVEKSRSGGRVVVVVGVDVDVDHTNNRSGQALAPRDGGVAEGAVGVVADLVEAIAHEVGVGLDGVAVGEVDSAVDVGSEEGGGGVEDGGGNAATAADGEAQALLQRVARAAVDALERALEERGPGVVAHLLDGLLVGVRVEEEGGGAPGRAENVCLLLEGEVEGGGGGGGVMMIMVDPGAVKGALGGDG
jgi:hypothetical protein